MQCEVCGWDDFVEAEYVSEHGRAPAVCGHLKLTHLGHQKLTHPTPIAEGLGRLAKTA